MSHDHQLTLIDPDAAQPQKIAPPRLESATEAARWLARALRARGHTAAQVVRAFRAAVDEVVDRREGR
jgi:hypothetical protein